MKQFFFFSLFLLIFLLCEPVFAIDCYGYFDSGSSLKGMSKIGSQWVGDNYYYSFNQNTEQQSLLDVCFATKSDIYSGSTNKIYFTVDYCVNANHVPKLSVYSSYYNSVDYTYDLGYKRYLTNADWSNSGCFRSFISLNMLTSNYSDSATGDYISEIQDNNNNFALLNDFGYGGILRYIDLVYYNANDYSAKLIEAKQLQSSQNIINGLNDLESGIDDVNDSVNAVNDSINDSSTTQAQNSGSSWFSNFRVDSTRGFSSIITAPVRLIQGILNGSSSCTALTYTINMKKSSASTTQSKEVSLPCGSILWNNVPNAAVLAYYSTIFGLFAWWILRDMYKFIDGVRDPDDKTEFLMKL